MNRSALSQLAVRLLLFMLFGCSDTDSDDAPAAMAVTLDFEMNVGGEPFACGATYPGVGSPAADFTVTDARFYAYDFELLDAGGQAHAVTLAADGSFQGQGIALLDFEDGCGPDGTPERNHQVAGNVAPGDFVAVRFTVGVPPELNFIDLTTAGPPLDVSGMFWVWQFGYRYLKVDGSVPSPEGGINPFLVHVGASGCPGSNPEAPPEDACSFPNRVSYELGDFSPDGGSIVADLADVLARSDLSRNTDGTAPGCMSEPEDPECLTLLPRLGIDDVRDQLLFQAK